MVLLTTATTTLNTELHHQGKSLHAFPRVSFSAVEKFTCKTLLTKGSWHRWGVLAGHATQLLKECQHGPDGLLAHPAAPLHGGFLQNMLFNGRPYIQQRNSACGPLSKES